MERSRYLIEILSVTILICSPAGAASGYMLNRIVRAARNQSGHWGYENKVDGLPPDRWASEYTSCSGKRQSPISIDTKLVKEDPSLSRFTFDSYGRHPADSQWTVVNNGHVVQFSGAKWDTGETPCISHGGLPADYTFAQFHFHWGSSASRGSEHVIDRKRYPLEVHLVHTKTHATDATDPTYIAVLGVFFETAHADEDFPDGFEEIVAAVRRVSEPGKPINITLPDLALKKLIPKSSSYFRYLGSLTTPPCSETVIWTVMEEPLKVSEAHMRVFRGLFEAANHTGHLEDNYRPVQELHGREVYHYSEPGPQEHEVVAPKKKPFGAMLFDSEKPDAFAKPFSTLITSLFAALSAYFSQ